MPIELTDTHTHTRYSGHGEGTPAGLVEAAGSLGLTTLAITEHHQVPHDLDPKGSFSMLPNQVEPYRAEVLAARAAAAVAYPELEVILGVEIDWFDGAEPLLLEQLQRYPYELVIGSVHLFYEPDGSIWEFDYDANIGGWYERGEEQVWREYLRLWTDMASSSLPIDILAHPDIPKKLGFPFPSKPGFDAREVYAAMAETAVVHDRMIEVNTAGLHKPIGEVYPAPDLLRAFCEAGVPCTVSSDAHRASEVGRDLSKAHAAMQAAGYTHITVPTRAGDLRTISLQS
jgi:histidinol-phosphatase (PHP family)